MGKEVMGIEVMEAGEAMEVIEEGVFSLNEYSLSLSKGRFFANLNAPSTTLRQGYEWQSRLRQ